MRRLSVLLLALFVWGCSTKSPVPDRTPSPTPRVSPSTTPEQERQVPSTTTVAVKGDWGAGTHAQSKVTEQMCAADRQTHFRYVITTGDNFYPSGDATPASYEQPESCLITRVDHEWKATWGNHDVTGDSTAKLLGASSKFYEWKAGGAHFFMLDSNAVGDITQMAWLDRALSESPQTLRIAVFHHPPYTVGSGHESNEAVRRNWVPLFRNHGLDLVLSGHNHLYEHSEVDGINYVVTGGGGAALYRCSRSAPWSLECRAAHHFLLLTIGSEVGVKAIDQDGNLIDSFIVKDR